MLITEKAEVFVSARTLRHYEEKGYEIPKKYSEKSNSYVLDNSVPILVKLEDLPDTSKTKIKYKCDNCGEIKITTYKNWIKRKYKELGDLCISCAVKIKLPCAMMEKYGVTNCANESLTIEKKKKTNLERYNNEWAIASEFVKKQIKEVFFEKYGEDNPMKNDEIKNKAIETNKKRYGGKSPMCDPTIREKSIKTCLEKYGETNPYKSKEVQEKTRWTRNKNGNAVSSKPEKQMCQLLKELYGEENCFENYPEGVLSLDCLVVLGEYKIDFEYDGKYWHKNRGQKDAARNTVLMREGYKIIRIKANSKDEIPSKKQIEDAVDYLVKGNHHLVFIDMNN